MDRELILKALGLLAEKLKARGLQGDLYIVGGAAMATAYDARRTTRDIDAVFVPKQEIYECAKLVVEEQGVPDNWLNDAVKGFLAV